MNRNAIVIGSNYSTSLGVIRSLGEAGYCVYLYYITSKHNGSKIAAVSRYVVKVVEHYNHREDEIINQLIQLYSSLENTVMIPTDDFSSMLISRYEKVLSKYFNIPYIGNGPYLVEKLMDKSLQNDIAKEHGIKAAKSWRLSYKSKGYDIPADIKFPCFLKPLASYNGGKSGMIRVNDVATLNKQLDNFHDDARKLDIILQGFLSIQVEYSISGVCLGKQVIMPSLLTKLKISKYKPGVTILGRIDNIDIIGHLRIDISEMLSSFDYYGLFDLELFKCEEEYYFNEINFRCSSICHIVTEAGVNLPAILADYLLFDRQPVVNQIEPGRIFISEKVAYEDEIAGYLSKSDLDECKSNASIYNIKNNLDPKPEKAFLIKMRGQKSKRRIKEFIQRLISKA